MKITPMKDWHSVPINFTGIIQFPNGNKMWLSNGKRHREDGPATIWAGKNSLRSYWYHDIPLSATKIKTFIKLGYPMEVAIKLVYFIQTKELK